MQHIQTVAQMQHIQTAAQMQPRLLLKCNTSSFALGAEVQKGLFSSALHKCAGEWDLTRALNQIFDALPGEIAGSKGMPI